MLFDNNDFNFLSFMGLNNELTSEIKLNDSTTGFVCGNMFEKEYKPYKDYKLKMPKTTCEKSAKLYRIMELSFAINDLNLYLDLHPDDEKIFKEFKNYTEKLLMCEEDYVKCYGPIEITENIFEKNMWVSSSPWEKEDSIYV